MQTQSSYSVMQGSLYLGGALCLTPPIRPNAGHQPSPTTPGKALLVFYY
jgi:hypothetical protein